MKTKSKITQSTSSKKLNTQLPQDSVKSSYIKEEIGEDLMSLDSQFESTAIEYSFTKNMNPNKLTKKKDIPDTTREYTTKLKKSNTNISLISSPRLLSPKEKIEMNPYLELKKKNFIEENKRNLIVVTKPLNDKSPSKQNIKTSQQYPPNSVESYSLAPRFPLQNSPQQNEFQVPLFYKNNHTKVIENDQNWSFGKLQEEERDNKTKSQFAQIPNCTYQKSTIKTNFSKPLLKLPKEFHAQSWSQIKK